MIFDKWNRQLTTEATLYTHRKDTTPETLFAQPRVPELTQNKSGRIVLEYKTNIVSRNKSPAVAPKFYHRQGDEDTTTNNSLHIAKIPALHIACQKGDLPLVKKISPYFHLDSRDFQGRTPLIYACQANKDQVVKWLLKNKVRINDVDDEGRCALHWAAYFGYNKILKMLISNGAIRAIRDGEGRTPTHLATGNLNTKCLKLLSNKADNEIESINEMDEEGMTALHWAVLYNRVEHVKLIISRKHVNLTATDVEGKIPLHHSCAHKFESTDTQPSKSSTSCASLLLYANQMMINIRDLDGKTPLHLACAVNNISLVSFLTKIDKIDLDIQDRVGKTALHWSAVAGYTQILQLLLSRGANDSILDFSGATSLHYAASKNHSQCVSALMSPENNRTPAYIQDLEGRYPLVWAVAKGHVQTCKILLDLDVDIASKDNIGSTALHAAAHAGQTKCASLLIERKADVNAVDNDGHTPLFRAAEKGFVEMASTLIQIGASVTITAKDGRSALHWAALFGNLPILSLLLANGAKTDGVDLSGKTPLICAAYNGHNEIIKFLLENGANANHADNQGRTALHWSSCNGHASTIELLLQRNVDVNALEYENDRCTPLDLAIIENQLNCIDILFAAGGTTSAEVRKTEAKKMEKAWRKHGGGKKKYSKNQRK